MLGRTGLSVSVAGLGCGGKSRLGQAQGRTFDDSVALVHAALDMGVNFVDTADGYGTEEIVGAALTGRREDIVVSTKVWFVDGTANDLSKMIDADAFERRVDGCLRRLGVERIDILHLHAVDPSQYDYVCTEFLPRLERLRERGKIRCTGLSERFISDTTHEMAIRAATDGYFDVLMIGLNYINQTALTTVLPIARANGIGTLGMFAVRGSLARRESAEAIVHKLIATGEVDAATIDDRDPLGFLTAPGVASSLSEAAYRFCRHAPGMDVTITGTGSREHLVDNVTAIGLGPLPDATLERLAEVFENVTSESAEP